MISAHYKIAKDYLEETQRIKSQSLKKELIGKAIDEFMWVIYLDKPFVSVSAEFYVGVCYVLLKESDSALHWFKRSHKTALVLLEKLKKVARKKYFTDRDNEGVNLSNMLLYISIIGIPVIWYKGWCTIRAKYAQESLKELQPLGEALEDLVISLGVATKPLDWSPYSL